MEEEGKATLDAVDVANVELMAHDARQILGIMVVGPSAARRRRMGRRVAQGK